MGTWVRMMVVRLAFRKGSGKLPRKAAATQTTRPRPSAHGISQSRNETAHDQKNNSRLAARGAQERHNNAARECSEADRRSDDTQRHVIAARAREDHGGRIPFPAMDANRLTKAKKKIILRSAL